jgi:hypothetical protein
VVKGVTPDPQQKQKGDVMDLTQYENDKIDEGAVLHVRDPLTGSLIEDDDGQNAMTITLISADSREYVRMQHRISNSTIRGTKPRKVTLEEIEDSALQMLAFATKSWTGMVLDGAPLECNQINARMVYKRFPWIKEQVDEFVVDRSNFLGN